MLGGVPGVEPGRVLILGGGIVGTQAAQMAAGLGAMVTILDVNLDRLRYLNDVMPANVVTRFSTEMTIRVDSANGSNCGCCADSWGKGSKSYNKGYALYDA